MDTIVAYADTLLGLSVHQASDVTIAQMCARAVVVYVVLIAYVRFAKKRFLGEATAFDVILVIIIGSVASRAISGNAPFFASLAATLVLIAMHWVLSYFTESSTWLSEIVKGHDTVLVRRGHVNHVSLRESHMSMDDLAEDLRQKGISDVKQVKEARLERSGQLSVIKK